eukprot:m.307402 g.307402  ORF g.307402 m.307402 type:complete len:588 (+) comp19628_c1_seq10:1392-3155(+)
MAVSFVARSAGRWAAQHLNHLPPAVAATATQRLGRSYATNTYLSQPFVVTPPVHNEPVNSFTPGSPERTLVKQSLEHFNSVVTEVPVVINGEQHFTENVYEQLVPANHSQVLARVSQATDEMVEEAVRTAIAARSEWELLPFEHRAAVFLKAADLIATHYRPRMLATTMLGQSKTVHQAEIEAACEAIDFLRFSVKYASQLYGQQPDVHDKHVWNRVIYRAMEGFVAAISPFNFTAIGANLAGAPALLGNAVVWKPANSAALSNFMVYDVLVKSGLPPGVINFVPCEPEQFARALSSPDLAAVNFTGSTKAFSSIWTDVGTNLQNYKTFPRLVGETGGKNWHVIHQSAALDNAVYATVRSAFEYQGQKCSACSRVYVPESLWPEFRDRLCAITEELTVGPTDDLNNFMGAVIDRPAYDRIKGFIDRAKTRSDTVTLLAGGECNDSVGYFVRPTVFQTTDPKDELMEREIFGPVITAYVYPDHKWEETLELVDSTSPYALTGAVFATSRSAISNVLTRLRHAAGNIYINAKSTGAVVGQQPFGGARASGTNDKAGASQYLLRFASSQSVKECLAYIDDYKYPHMLSDE